MVRMVIRLQKYHQPDTSRISPKMILDCTGSALPENPKVVVLKIWDKTC